MNRPIALATDFGLKDHYVGSLKGVILDINPHATIFDITHEIRPQNIFEGAFVLNSVYSVLPKGTIVVAVVDPGVGGMRQALCVKTSRGYLIGPNNGILSLVLAHEAKYEIRALENERYFRKPVSSTFHGRDIFAPSAAWLSRSDVFRSFGPRIRKIHTLRIPKMVWNRDAIRGEVVYVDRFGNAITNIQRLEVDRKTHGQGIRIFAKRRKEVPLKPFFSSGASGALIAVWNSGDLLELAVKNDSAERRHRLRVGDPVTLRIDKF